MSPSKIFPRTFLCFVMAALIAVLSLGAPLVLNLRGSPSVLPQACNNRKVAVIDAALKRWRVPHCFSDRRTLH
jgi:hypothetical protein